MQATRSACTRCSSVRISRTFASAWSRTLALRSRSPTAISQMSRAVGRAARTALLLAPLETTEIRVTYTTNGLPVATYEFSDLQKLNRYFNGLSTRSALVESVAIRYADPSSYSERETAELMAALEEPTQAKVLYGDEGGFISFKSQDVGLNLFQVKPVISTYLNGPEVF